MNETTRFADEQGTELKVGDLVKVRGPYQMADHKPYIGNGKIGTDAITGRVFRIVKLCPAVSRYSAGFDLSSKASAELADPTLIGVDESDADHDVILTRLTKYTGNGAEVVF